jgi:hypothetical protein
MNAEMENEDFQPAINQQPTPDTPPAIQEVPDESVAMPKKTLIVFPTVILLILVSLFAGYLLYQNYLLKQQITKLTTTPSPTATTNPTTNWKTYTNTKYGFEFKYPTSDVDQTIKKTIDDEDNFSITDNVSFVIQKTSLKKPCDGICYSTYNGDHTVNGIQFSVAEGKYDDPGGREVCEEDCVTQYVDNETEVATGVYAQIRSGSLPSKREETTNLVNQILSTFKFTDQQVKIAEWKTYSNTKMGFSMSIPAEWVAWESKDQTGKNDIFFGPEDFISDAKSKMENGGGGEFCLGVIGVEEIEEFSTSPSFETTDSKINNYVTKKTLTALEGGPGINVGDKILEAVAQQASQMLKLYLCDRYTDMFGETFDYAISTFKFLNSK